MIRRFRFSGLLLAAVVVLALSDTVQADTFGATAPLVRFAQTLGSKLALAVEQTLAPVLAQLAPAGLPVSPTLVLGGGVAFALGLLRARARRDRSRGR